MKGTGSLVMEKQFKNMSEVWSHLEDGGKIRWLLQYAPAKSRVAWLENGVVKTNEPSTLTGLVNTVAYYAYGALPDEPAVATKMKIAEDVLAIAGIFDTSHSDYVYGQVGRQVVEIVQAHNPLTFSFQEALARLQNGEVLRTGGRLYKIVEGELFVKLGEVGSAWKHSFASAQQLMDAKWSMFNVR